MSCAAPLTFGNIATTCAVASKGSATTRKSDETLAGARLHKPLCIAFIPRRIASTGAPRRIEAMCRSRKSAAPAIKIAQRNAAHSHAARFGRVHERARELLSPRRARRCSRGRQLRALAITSRQKRSTAPLVCLCRRSHAAEILSRVRIDGPHQWPEKRERAKACRPRECLRAEQLWQPMQGRRQARRPEDESGGHPARSSSSRLVQ